MKKNLILIVDDEPEVRNVLFEGLSKNGHSIFFAGNAGEALCLFEQKQCDLVITDVKLPDRDGLQLLDQIKKRSPHTPVILMTGFGTVQNAVEAMRKGAFDYVLKPFSLNLMEERIRMALHENVVDHDADIGPPNFSTSLTPIITRNQRMKEMMDLCQRIGPTKATILIQGESGTGKELFAQLIHSQSPRREGPFIAVNCAALPETLFESELFGHEKGAFTGALMRKIGKFELAQQGTILLDEISEMSPLLQAKILRVLQESEVDRIGGKMPIPIDVRVIATTNKNLEDCIEKGELREDLYYRLNVISMKLPSLRERVEDIELLADYFLSHYAKIYGKAIHHFSDGAMNWLKRQPWRGNVRELKNVMERAVLVASGSILDLKDLCPEERNNSGGNFISESSPLSLKEMEKNLIFKALEKTNGNRTYAAKILGISIRTLRNKLHEYKQGLSSQEIS
jgi:DNA-binding NtrC family response regulator